MRHNLQEMVGPEGRAEISIINAFAKPRDPNVGHGFLRIPLGIWLTFLGRLQVKLFLTLPTLFRAFLPLIEENNVADGGYSWTERKR